ncbi:hypothetical protein [Pedobacter gandavensis]|uniref:hypothetical protein n=1 Tax=Pedobacter gandavensis TaxID=2679963 RepID=UPI00292F0BD2|nr:hypothetical protein [Pedobacter gandavensis]
MFEKYKNEVIEAYNSKRAAGLLSSHLVQASPAELKRECLKVYGERYSQKDARILRAFFGPETEEKDFSKLIIKTEPDRFKPLRNLMKGTVQDPRLINIDLLAWLIDFNPRPHALWENNVVVLNGGPGNPSPELPQKIPVPQPPDDTPLPEPPKDTPVPKPNRWARFKTRENLIAAMILLVIGIGVYMITVTPPFKQCMYWAEDHYEAISCTEKKEDVEIIPINEDRIANFKKITLPDTLTVSSLGKVWYISNRGVIEFFTAPGEYPLDRNKRVLPMSKGILQKYVLNKDL